MSIMYALDAAMLKF